MSSSNRYIYKKKLEEPSILKKLCVKFGNLSAKQLLIIGGICTFGMGLCGVAFYHYIQYKNRLSDYNTVAIEELLKHDKFVDVLGKPVKAGYVFSRVRGGFQEDHVDIIVPINGTEAEGLLKYQADRVNDRWIIRKMEFSFLGKAGGIVRLVKDERATETTSKT